MTTGATTPGNSYSIVNNSFHKKKKSIFSENQSNLRSDATNNDDSPFKNKSSELNFDSKF